MDQPLGMNPAQACEPILNWLASKPCALTLPHGMPSVRSSRGWAVVIPSASRLRVPGFRSAKHRSGCSASRVIMGLWERPARARRMYAS